MGWSIVMGGMARNLPMPLRKCIKSRQKGFHGYTRGGGALIRVQEESNDNTDSRQSSGNTANKGRPPEGKIFLGKNPTMHQNQVAGEGHSLDTEQARGGEEKGINPRGRGGAGWLNGGKKRCKGMPNTKGMGSSNYRYVKNRFSTLDYSLQ